MGGTEIPSEMMGHTKPFTVPNQVHEISHLLSPKSSATHVVQMTCLFSRILKEKRRGRRGLPGDSTTLQNLRETEKKYGETEKTLDIQI